MKQHHILLIDDDNDYREIMSTKLKAVGIHVCSVASGKEGIEKAKDCKPDLILLDVQMPEMDGMATLQEMRKIPELAETKVVFLTNLGEPPIENTGIDQRVATDIGAMGHIRKGDDLDQIVNQIKIALDGYEK